MNYKKTAPFIVVAFLIFTAFTLWERDPHDIVITEENYENLLTKELKDKKGLTAGEIGTLLAYQVRVSLDGKFKPGENTANPMIGKTLGEAIKDQEVWVAEQQAKQQEEKRKKEELRKKLDEARSVVREAISLKILSKTYIPANWRERSYRDYIAFKVVLINECGRDIKAINGLVTFKDLFGKVIYKTKVEYTNGLKNGYNVEWPTAIEYNQFSSALNTLRAEKMDNLETEWEPRNVIFSDGEKLDLEDI